MASWAEPELQRQLHVVALHRTADGHVAEPWTELRPPGVSKQRTNRPKSGCRRLRSGQTSDLQYNDGGQNAVIFEQDRASIGIGLDVLDEFQRQVRQTAHDLHRK